MPERRGSKLNRLERELPEGLLVTAKWMINYAQRHRTSERVGTSQTESAANFLVNERMNKSQQMRWSAIGANRILQIRAAVTNEDFRGSQRRLDG